MRQACAEKDCRGLPFPLSPTASRPKKPSCRPRLEQGGGRWHGEACAEILAALWASAISWNTGLFCKHSKLGQLCEVWPWLGQPSSLSKQQEIFFLFLPKLNLLWVHNLYSSSELQSGFLPKKEKHLLRFSTHPPHPAGRMPRLPSKAGAGLLRGRAGMCRCCRGRRAALSGVAVVVQAGVLYRSGQWATGVRPRVGRKLCRQLCCWEPL